MPLKLWTGKRVKIYGFGIKMPERYQTFYYNGQRAVVKEFYKNGCVTVDTGANIVAVHPKQLRGIK